MGTEKLRLASPFRIAGHVFEHWEAVAVTLSEGPHRGRGEASGVYYLGDDAPHMLAAVEAARDAVEGGATRAEINASMPAGGARNALDCALWELESHAGGRPVWAIAGLPPPKPLVTVFTIGADDPDAMARSARDNPAARALKLKLTGDLRLDLERVRAVRAARPDVWLAVDANQGFERGDIEALACGLAARRVAILEQPLARGREADMEGLHSPIPLVADESAIALEDLPGLVGRFDMVNIKLDKCGGLTEALAMATEARQLGLGVMVGNMMGTSLAMAPGFLIGQLCDVVDLDGPTFLTADRSPSVVYRDGFIDCPDGLWGADRR